MKTIVLVVSCLMAMALAAPQEEVSIVKYETENNVDSYSFDFETSDGTSRSEKGELKNAGGPNEALSVTGTFSYVGPDGVTYTVTYVADENGFRPTGDHIPKPL